MALMKVFWAPSIRSPVSFSESNAAPAAPRANRFPLSRRDAMLLGATTLLAPLRPAGAAAAAIFPTMEEPILPGFKTIDSGLRVQEVVEGNGATASEGDLVEFNYVCRRSNGYFVYSTVDLFSGESAPITLPLDGTTMISGLEKVLLGMKPGGKRRGVIPAAAGYLSTNLQPLPNEFGPQRSLLSHAKEPLLFEVQLLKIK